jgi:hypothetical protein
MKYNLKHIYDSYLSGYESIDGVPSGGEDIAPKVRDPQHKNRVCKHLLAAFTAVMTNWMTILKAARTYHVPAEVTPKQEPATPAQAPVQENPVEEPMLPPVPDENISPDENGI